MNMSGEELTELLPSLGMTGEDASFENNLKTLGYADFDNPSEIDIYPKDFESKSGDDRIFLTRYNSRRRTGQRRAGQDLSYTDR